MSTTLEKFRGAALSLARSGSIKDRLTDAEVAEIDSAVRAVIDGGIEHIAIDRDE